MNPELEKQLFEKYPHFFRDKDDKQRSLMGFGFGCGDGWFHLIDNILNRFEDERKQWENSRDSRAEDFKMLKSGEKLNWHPSVIEKRKRIMEWVENNPNVNPWEAYCEVQQVKEKFGGLRFYATYPPKDLWYFYGGGDAFVEAHTSMSYRICETCGSPGRLRDQQEGFSWIQTLCDKHAEAVTKTREEQMKEWKQKYSS